MKEKQAEDAAVAFWRHIKGQNEEFYPFFHVEFGENYTAFGVQESDLAPILYSLGQQIEDLSKIVLMTEGWSVTRQTLDDLEGSVSDQPDRREVFVINIMTPDDARVVMYDIVDGDLANRQSFSEVEGRLYKALKRGIDDSHSTGKQYNVWNKTRRDEH